MAINTSLPFIITISHWLSIVLFEQSTPLQHTPQFGFYYDTFYRGNCWKQSFPSRPKWSVLINLVKSLSVISMLWNFKSVASSWTEKTVKIFFKNLKQVHQSLVLAVFILLHLENRKLTNSPLLCLGLSQENKVLMKNNKILCKLSFACNGISLNIIYGENVIWQTQNK